MVNYSVNPQGYPVLCLWQTRTETSPSKSTTNPGEVSRRATGLCSFQSTSFPFHRHMNYKFRAFLRSGRTVDAEFTSQMSLHNREN